MDKDIQFGRNLADALTLGHLNRSEVLANGENLEPIQPRTVIRIIWAYADTEYKSESRRWRAFNRARKAYWQRIGSTKDYWTE